MQLIGAFLCLFSVFSLVINQGQFRPEFLINQIGIFNKFFSSVYTAFSPILFNFGLIMILLPSLQYVKTDESKNNLLRADLTSLFMYDGWRVLFKISQAAYICHYLVIFWYYASVTANGFMINRWVLMRVAFGAYVLSFILGLVYYLTFDKPIRNLDKLVLFPSKISDSFLIKKAAKVHKKAPRVKFAQSNGPEIIVTEMSTGT